MCLGVLVMVTALAGESPVMYRWTGADGVIHFSDRPPPDQSAQIVKPDPTLLIGVPPTPKAREYQAPPPRRKQRRKPADGKNAERCHKVLERIDTLNSRMRAGYNAKQGERMRDQLREYKKDRLKWCLGRGK